MKSIYIKRTIKRTAEFILPCAIMSAIVTWLNVAGHLPTRMLTLIGLAISAAIYLFLNWRFSRNSAFRLKNLPLYYGVSYTAFGVFVLVIYLVYKLFGNVPFTWAFAVLKIAIYVQPSIPTFFAVGFFLFVLFLIVTLAPVGMKFVTMYHDEDKDNV